MTGSGCPGGDVVDMAPPDDLVQPFQVDVQQIRGRLVRLGPLVDTILARHGYPDLVAGMLGEAIALTATFSAALKFDGVFSLQTKSDGPVSVLVADATSDGEIRGYAAFDADRIAALQEESAAGSVPRLLGAGYLAFTVDQGADTERYQGIVELMGAGLVDCVQHYFQQSEQFDAAVLLAAGRVGGAPSGDRLDGPWRAGALMIQRLPPEDPLAPDVSEVVEEGWRRALALMASGTRDELLDPDLAPTDLLYRLFHEEGVRAYMPRPLAAGCRCSRERAAATLEMLSRQELDEMTVDGRVTVTCQFCNRTEDFADPELAALRAG